MIKKKIIRNLIFLKKDWKMIFKWIIPSIILVVISCYVTGWFAIYISSMLLGSEYYTGIGVRLIIGFGIEWIIKGGIRINQKGDKD